MRMKRRLAFLLAFVMMCTLCTMTAFAEEPGAEAPVENAAGDTRAPEDIPDEQDASGADVGGDLSEAGREADPTVGAGGNGSGLGYEKAVTVAGKEADSNDAAVAAGETVVLSVKNVTYNGVAVGAGDVQYVWQKITVNGGTETISGAEDSEYSFTYQGEAGFMCTVSESVNGDSADVEFRLKEKDPLVITNVSSSANLKESTGLLGELTYDIEGVSQGEEITFEIETGFASGRSVQYGWSYGVRTADNDDFSGDEDFEEPEEPDFPGVANDGTATFTKQSVGRETVLCRATLYDASGNPVRDEFGMPVSKSVRFRIYPGRTLKATAQFNSTVPAAPMLKDDVQVLYGAATKVGDMVTLKVNAVSSSGGSLKYTWRENYKSKVLGTSDSLTVKKAEPAYSYGSESGEEFVCWVEDGNDTIRMVFYLFTLNSGQVTTVVEGKPGTPAISMNNDNMEELTNTVLQDYMEDLGGYDGRDKENATIKLEASARSQVADTESAAISAALPKDGKVGTYLDINLYAEVGGRKDKIEEAGTDISLTIEVPKDMLNSDGAVDRSYQVVRMHDGKAETLDCDFDAKKGAITFETDKFSTYALAYTDIKKSTDTGVKDPEPSTGDQTGGQGNGNQSGNQGSGNQPGGNQTGNQGTGNQTGSQGSGNQAGSNGTVGSGTGTDGKGTAGIQTGDTSNLMLWWALLFVSCSAAVGVVVYGKAHNQRRVPRR